MKRKIDITRSQCDHCGLVGDRTKYHETRRDENGQYEHITYSTKCPHCKHAEGFRIIK